MKSAISRACALLLAGLLPALAVAEGALYKPQFPPGAGMARVFNAGGDLAAGAARFGDKALAALPAGALSQYQPVPAGKRTVSCGRKAFPVDLREGTFHTVVCGGRHDGRLLVDPVPVHVNKTFVILYNLGGSDAIRLLANGRIPVIDKVAAGATGSREINPVRVELAVHDGDAVAFRLGEVPLAPEKVYSLFVVQEAGETRAWLRESLLNAEI